MSSSNQQKERASMAVVVAVEGEVEVIVAPSGEIMGAETGDPQQHHPLPTKTSSHLSVAGSEVKCH